MPDPKQSSLPGVSRANHANQGKLFEAELETTHDWYRLQKRADVRRIPNTWAFISRNEYLKLKHKLPPTHLARTEDGRFMQRVKSDVDFVGGGEKFSICFDAKTCAGDRFPFGNLTEHQFYKLRDRERCRILSGVMLYLSDHKRVFFIPLAFIEKKRGEMQRQMLGRRAKPGTASIPLAELETGAVEIKRHANMCWDWHAALVK